jgi:site-specific recombinase XerD
MRASETPPPAFSEQLEIWLHSNDYSDNTIALYHRAALGWLTFSHPWEDGWQMRSIEWRRSLNRHALKTQAVFVGAAKGFVDWLMDEKILTGRNPLASVRFRGLKAEALKRRALSDDEVGRLLGSCDQTTDKGFRDYTILNVMLHTALRIGAVSRFDIEDVERRGDLHVVNYQGKGQTSKTRIKVLPDNIVDLISEYLERTGRSLDDKGPMWVGWGDKKLSIHGVRKAIVRRLVKCGIKEHSITTHSLRHTAATKAIESGADLQGVQQFLDHESIATTDGYVHARRQIQQAAELTISYDLEKKNAKPKRRAKRSRKGKAARGKAR